MQRDMRFLFLLALLLLLPFQSFLATAASYCAHEQCATQHLGHHEHKHVAKAMDSSPSHGSLGDHPDCAGHQLNIAVVVATLLPSSVEQPAAFVRSFDPPNLSSLHAYRPERPQWFSAV